MPAFKFLPLSGLKENLDNLIKTSNRKRQTDEIKEKIARLDKANMSDKEKSIILTGFGLEIKRQVKIEYSQGIWGYISDPKNCTLYNGMDAALGINDKNILTLEEKQRAVYMYHAYNCNNVLNITHDKHQIEKYIADNNLEANIALLLRNDRINLIESRKAMLKAVESPKPLNHIKPIVKQARLVMKDFACEQTGKSINKDPQYQATKKLNSNTVIHQQLLHAVESRDMNKEKNSQDIDNALAQHKEKTKKMNVEFTNGLEKGFTRQHINTYFKSFKQEVKGIDFNEEVMRLNKISM